MASHVVVVDSTARRSQIKTTPGTYLSDIRDAACHKFGVPASQFTLKHDKKALDLTQNVRWANLPQGAKLDLVQQSRSPTVVNVALQLPESDKSLRLTQKLPNTTTLWQALRIFESLPTPGNAQGKFNFTQRAATGWDNESGSGSGRLNYESPVLNVVGRERSSFVELQQTLGQLGISGSTLIRLSYRDSGKPLEEAMVEISQYFEGDQQSATTHTPQASTNPNTSGEAAAPTLEAAAGVVQGDVLVKDHSAPEVIIDASEKLSADPEPGQAIETQTAAHEIRKKEDVPPPVPGVGVRNIQVFQKSASNGTVAAASVAHNASDYDLSVDQLVRLRSSYLDQSKNTRLLSDRELEAAEDAKLAKLAAIATVRLAIDMPDEIRVQATFTQDDTVADLYKQVRDLLQHDTQPFKIKAFPEVLQEGPRQIIRDAGIRGPTVLRFLWDDTVSMDVRRGPSLKTEWRTKTQALRIEQPPSISQPEDETRSSDKVINKGKGKADGVDKESKLKALMDKHLFKTGKK